MERKEAIEVIKKNWPDSSFTMLREALETIIPELKESKDEKIRKWLICTLKSLNNSPVQIDGAYEMMLPAIDWLGKRGEQKSVPDWMTKFLDELRIKKNYFDWDEHKDIEGGILAIIDWMNPTYFNEKEGGQEPIEWSGKIGVKHAEGKLKEMLDRKENSTWSEEDENRINRLIAYFEDKESFTAEDDIVYANWLNSLKERYTWKPSDEQMDMLKIAVSTSNSIVLDSLYNDLMKLKE